MLRVAISIVILGFFQFSRVNCFKFSIAKDISQSNPLDETNWCFVEITENENVSVKVDIPSSILYSGVFIYFANGQKKILKVNLNKTVEGTLYEIPYKPINEMKGEKTETVESDNFRQVTAEFPKSWLPDNCNKVSATVECVDGRILNYYSIQNLKISFPDVLVLEEFKNYKSNLKEKAKIENDFV